MKLLYTLFVFLVAQLCAQVHAEDVMFPGTVYSKSRLNLSVEQSGLLLYVAQVGSRFKAGDPIAKIDSRYEQQQIAQLKLQQDTLKAKIVENQKIIDSYAQLTKENLVSEEQRAQKNIDLLNSKYELNLLELELIRFRDIMDKKNIYAPYDGVVLGRQARADEVIQAGAPLATILDPKALYLDVRIPLNIYESVDLQQASLANVSPSTSLQLDSAIPEVDTRSNTVRVLFKVVGDGILVGQSLQVKFPK